MRRKEATSQGRRFSEGEREGELNCASAVSHRMGIMYRKHQTLQMCQLKNCYMWLVISLTPKSLKFPRGLFNPFPAKKKKRSVCPGGAVSLQKKKKRKKEKGQKRGGGG